MCVLLCSSIKCNVTAHFKDFRNTMTMKHYETHWSTHRFCNSLRLTVKRSICFPQPLRVFDHLHARDQQTLQYEHSHLDRNRPYLGIRFRRWYWFFLTRFQHLQVPSSVMFPLASSYHTSDPDIARMLWPFKCLFINWSKKIKAPGKLQPRHQRTCSTHLTCWCAWNDSMFWACDFVQFVLKPHRSPSLVLNPAIRTPCCLLSQQMIPFYYIINPIFGWFSILLKKYP